ISTHSTMPAHHCQGAPRPTQLSSTNYTSWCREIKAYLRIKGLWRLVIGAEKHPNDSNPHQQARWDLSADMAAGELFFSLSEAFRPYIEAVEDNPTLIWSTLASIHSGSSCPGPSYVSSPTKPSNDASFSPLPCQSDSATTEYAGNASLRIFDPSDPSYRLQLDASTDWNADTCATSHMTPHRHWLRNYKPKSVPIKLADNKIVYSAGIGEVLFVPIINGQKAQPLLFTSVLHVPDLRNNLLSVLFLAKQKNFTITIDSSCMSFQRPAGVPRFIASILSNNSAFLDGQTVPLVEQASSATSIPLDFDLWHRRLAHHNLADVKRLSAKNLVTGMTLNSKTESDPICEPCLAGKMHSNPFYPSEWHASRPLELIHSDVHGVSHLSFSGYRYWVTFIDDYSRFHFVLPIKAKSDVFEAFKTFKVFAENQSERKIKILRDDKGGEYMYNAFLKFTQECGILRQHTTRNRPQQNGVTERANRLISERITAMLDETGLSKAFWGECLASLVHVLNRCSTDALKDATPYSLWHGVKPDVSHLRVWGCTAYVLIQKDKRHSLDSHVEKCVFIGYPEGYKGWKFFNPTTKHTIISERAEFDERYFPLSKRSSQPSPTASTASILPSNLSPSSPF